MVAYQQDLHGLTRELAEFSRAGTYRVRMGVFAGGREVHGEQ